jgi:hypothetical protein
MSETQPDTKLPEPVFPDVDVSKRYDVYCSEGYQRLVVYRDVRFKSVQKLLSVQKFDFLSIFIELEQADGKSFFIPKQGLAKFCEHGIEPVFEVIATK